MKKRGFTLIELLVAIVIMGLLFVIAVPAMGNLLENNRNKKYIAYESSLISAAKVYMHSYKDDIFPNMSNGCYVLKYSELKEKKLIKNIQEKNVKCDRDSDTYVTITKMNDNYYYGSSIVCRKIHKKKHKIVYAKSNARKNCQLKEDKEAPTITLSPDKFDWVKTSDASSIKIDIEDNIMGLKKNIKLKYQWVKEDRSLTDNWRELSFNNEEGSLFESDYIDKSSYPTETGKYYLYIDDGIEDIVGNKTDVKKVGLYQFDNSAPTIPTSTIKTQETNRWLDESGRIKDNMIRISEFKPQYYICQHLIWSNFYATDDNSGINHYEYSVNGITKQGNLGSSYTYGPRTNSIFYIRSVDNAGNVSPWSKSYIIYIGVKGDDNTCNPF